MKAVKRAIILCWIMLIACFIIKLIGGNWFEVICNNENFIRVCNYIDTHLIVNYCIAFPIYAIPAFIALLACCIIKRPTFKQAIVILAFICASWSVQFISPYAKIGVEAVTFLCLPFLTRCIKNGFSNWKQAIKKTWYLGIIGGVLTFGFQALSFVTKNIGIKIVEENSLLSMILMVDYFIMIILYYLYVRLKIKKEELKNG